MENAKSHVVVLVVVTLMISGVTYPWFRNPTVWDFFLPLRQSNGSSIATSSAPSDELEAALERASMGNNTVIIAMVNKAYSEKNSVLELFLKSFHIGENTEFLLNHLLLIAVDQTAFDRCNLLNLHCHRLVTDGVDFSEEKLYMSEDFIKMMWQRTLFLANVLRRGYNFIFTDTDVMWLRNPFTRLSQVDDIQISCDGFNGKPIDQSNPANTGFYYVTSNNRTIALFDMWHALKDNSTGMKEQDVLQNMIQRGVVRELGVKMRFLDTLYFGGFCQDSRDFQLVTTMHANCCRSIKAKLVDLTAVLEDWKRFRSCSNLTSTTMQWSPHKACINSWKV